MIRVALADDQHLVRTGLRVIVDAEPDLTVVGEAGGGREALAVCARESRDVVLMDIRMPVMDGIEATSAPVIGPVPVPRVLILTTFDLDSLVYAALKAGANGFLLKDAPADLLTAAIRTVSRGETLLDRAQAVIAAYESGLITPARADR